MTTTLVKPAGSGMNYTKFATPLALDPPAHCGLPTIYLGPGRHSLGTDPQCSITLRADGVHARHVLILASEHRTVVKALDPRTWVNEGPVVETALRPGDRLSLGPLTFRVRAARNDELALFVPARESLDAPLPHFEVSTPAANKPERRSDVRIDVGTKTEPNGQIVKSGTRTHLPATSPAEGDTIPSSTRQDVGPIAKTQIQTPARESNAASDTVSKNVEVASPTSKSADGSIPASAVNEKLDSRLEQIQSTLAGLHQSARETSALPPERLLQADSLAAERRRLEMQQSELQRRADELAQRSKQLSERFSHVVEREAEVERVRAQLAAEGERLSATSDATRRELADEYSRQMSLWQEWDAAYRRTSLELETQLKEADERRRNLVAETERIAVERSDAQREKAELERERRALAAEKVQLASDRSSLQTQRAQFDTERQQFTLTMQEREGQLMADRRALDHLQDELSLSRQHFERERTTFLGERAAEGQRREREIREHVELRRQLDDETAAVRADRRDLETLRRELDIERYAFDTIRGDLESDARETAPLRAMLQQTQAELDMLKLSRPATVTPPLVPLIVPPAIPLVESPESRTASQVEARSDDANRFEHDLNAEPPSVAETQTEHVLSASSAREADVPTPLINRVPTQIANQLPASFTNREDRPDTSLVADRVESLSSFGVPQSELHETAATSLETTLTGMGNSVTPFAHVNESISSSPTPTAGDGIWSAQTSTHEAGMTSFSELNSGLHTSSSPTGTAPIWKTQEEQDTPFVAGDSEFAVSSTTAVMAESATAHQTLEEVTREFGVASSTEQPAPEEATSEKKAPALPAWWKGDDSESNLLDELFSEQRTEEDGSKSDPAASGDPLALLRSQLAAVMEGNDTTTRERMDRDRFSDTQAWPQSTDSESNEGSEANSDRNGSGDVFGQVSEVTPATAANDDETAVSPNDSQLETPPATPQAVPNEESSAEATPTTTETEGKSDAGENEDSEEADSIEDQIARLLARSRGDSAPPVASSKPSTSPSTKSSDPPKITETFDVKDRSHLKAAPKHSLDKNAARKNLQSFRQVAKQSVKTALAKHKERRQFNMFLAKAMTFGVCLTSSVLFLGGRLLGMNFSLVGGVASAALTVICALELIRAHFNIQKSRKKTAVEVENHSVASEQLAASLAHPLKTSEQKKQ